MNSASNTHLVLNIVQYSALTNCLQSSISTSAE